MGATKYSADGLAALRYQTTVRMEEVLEAADEATLTAGMEWYFTANKVARSIGDVDRTAAIIAALSPRVRWAQNIEDAYLVFHEQEGQTVAFGLNLGKAMAVQQGEDPETVLGGRKVRAFWRNIRYPWNSDDVTLDGWMAKAVGIPVKHLELKGVYDAISDGIRDAAEENGLRPHQVQAIVWIHERGSAA